MIHLGLIWVKRKRASDVEYDLETRNSRHDKKVRELCDAYRTFTDSKLKLFNEI